MVGKRSAVVDENQIVQDVENYVVAKNGETHQVVRALVSCDGKALEFFPTTEVTPFIVSLEDGAIIDTFAFADDPDDALASLLAENATGKYYWADENEVTQSAFFAQPAVTALEQVWIRMDQVSGTILVQPVDVWIDAFSSGSPFNFDWRVQQLVIGTQTAQGTFRVALDNGAGAPDLATEKTVTVNFHAQVNGDVLMGTNAWSLEHITINGDALTKVEFLPDASMNGYEGPVKALTDNYATPGFPTSPYTVTATLVSGDPLTGAPFDVPLDLSTAQEFILLADADAEDFTSEVDFLVNGPINDSTRRVTFHSKRTDTAIGTVIWPETGQGLTDVAVTSSGPAQVFIDMLNNRFSSGGGIITGIQMTDAWHDGADFNPANFEVFLEIDTADPANDLPTVGSDGINAWINLVVGVHWEWDSPSQFTVPFLSCSTIVHVRAVGQESTKKSRPVVVIVNPANAP